MKAIQTLQDLQEHPVLGIFESITTMPRPSGGEEQFGNWIISYAVSHTWTVKRDLIGNVLVSVPATAGREGQASICLQAHQDMVCLDDQGTTLGRERWPLALRIDGDWLSATGTTLGADNGIGVAIALALAGSDDHGPLELLFTVQEETGLTGAFNLGLTIRSKILINLDSEDWGFLFIGCAGGIGAAIESPCKYLPLNKDCPTWLLSVGGLQGGHSGLEINKGRVNAVRLVADVLEHMSINEDFRLVSLTGGSRSNAIPASAQAVFACSVSSSALLADFEQARFLMQEVYLSDEPGMQICLIRTDQAKFTLDIQPSLDVVALITNLPNGVISMSPALDIPQTSINLGVARLDQESGKLSLTLMARSSVMSDLSPLKDDVISTCRIFSKRAKNPFPVTVTFNEGYPGWEPQLDSVLVDQVRSIWAGQFKVPLTVTAVHAGLECGLLKAKFPKVDMVSLGPDIRGAHSANERVSISSVNECYGFVQVLLKVLG